MSACASTAIRPREGENAYAISRAEIDCARSAARIVGTINYHADGSQGVADFEIQPFRTIAPDSLFADLRERICPGAGQ